jgi:hypothetical protein
MQAASNHMNFLKFAKALLNPDLEAMVVFLFSFKLISYQEYL